ncbi:MAG TPA: hypothetical protein VM597_39225 [Gemmataceae bacterium]|nr:hypothetical protein [Gemmataceae bacterium]
MAKGGSRPLFEVCAVKPTHGWVALHRLYTDLKHKKADVFVWVILARDLRNVQDPDDLQRVCMGREQKKWNGRYPMGKGRQAGGAACAAKTRLA